MYGMSKMELHNYCDHYELNANLAIKIINQLNNAVAQNGRAYMVVSGGKTPVELFKILAQAPIPWDNITITLADERCVAINDINRNEGVVRNYLLQHAAKKARFISLYNEHVNINDGIKKTSQDIGSLPAFDVVILGMGEDGHTASLFPCSKELALGIDDHAAPVLLVTPQTAPYQRVSLSKKRLMNSHLIFIHFTGQKKLAILDKALAEPNPLIMPISAFLNIKNSNVQVMYAP
jgi:6-phosphogluconolactonase